jgi:hypothetical protein
MDKIIALTAAQRAEVFQAAAQQSGMSAVILEKDFWACWTLRRLFALPGVGEHLIFKGGTSLSKVWKAIERFSEDIDVSLSREWLGFTGDHDPENAGSRKQQRKRLDDLSASCAEKIRTVLLPALRQDVRAHLGDAGWQMEIDGEDSQTVLFNYPSAVAPSIAGAYVRREVRIECGARSDAWPAEPQIVVPYVAQVLAGVVADANVAVTALAIERTYWEKATILHAEAHREEGKATPPRFSRHYADLAALAHHAVAKDALNRDDLRERVVAHKQVFFASTWASYETAVPGSFRLVPGDARLQVLAQDYRDMREMFFGEPLSWEEIVVRLRALETSINERARS